MATKVTEPTANATAPVDAATTKPASSKLKELIDAANLQYGLKNYAEAADLYSSATELQAELNGEMAPENADLLYRYGRCLYQVAVAKSDVLGGKVAGEKKKGKTNGAAKTNGAGGSGSSATAAELMPPGDDTIEAAVGQKDAREPSAQEKTVEQQPYFQITGMENWDSDEEDEEGDAGEAEGDDAEEDDFATAYEVLDLARVLLQRQLEMLQSDQTNGIAAKGKGAAVDDDDNSPARQIQVRLADTHDLQAEISLENERFSDAIPDFRASLTLKQDLYTKESSMLAEAHYKLSLALEFASVDKVREAQAQEGQQTVQVKKEDIDEAMRKEAAAEMEAAIESCRLRITKEEEALKGLGPEGAEKQKTSIKEVKEIVEDMESRLNDLRDPNSLTRLDDPTGAPETMSLAGVLAQALGETPAQQKTRIEEATKNARDLTDLVRHRKKPTTGGESDAAASAAAASNGKRKLEEAEEAEAEDGTTKKVRVDE